MSFLLCGLNFPSLTPAQNVFDRTLCVVTHDILGTPIEKWLPVGVMSRYVVQIGW